MHLTASFYNILALTLKANLVSQMLEVGLEVFFGAVEEAVRLKVSSAERQQVHCRQPCLLAGRDEDDDGELARIAADGVVDGLHHGEEAGGRVRDVETLQREKGHTHTHNKRNA